MLEGSSYDFEPTFNIYFVIRRVLLQISPNKNKSPNLWHVASILVCCIFEQNWSFPVSALLAEFCQIVKYPLLDLVITMRDWFSLLHLQCSAPNSDSYEINFWIVWICFQISHFEVISDVQWWKQIYTHFSDSTHL